MKEAIKVQSVTITIINGISEAFQVHVGLYRRQTRSLLTSWLPLGENKGKELVCGQEGSEGGLNSAGDQAC
jgi:hypothetical protein